MKNNKTLADVAAAAGVSKMTASRALRGEKDVSRTNVERVKQAAHKIGYVGNQFASSLSRQHTNLIGVVVPSLTNVVFPQVMSGVTEALKGSVLQPVFGVTEYDPDIERETLRNILSWRPAGLIVTGLDQPPDTRRLLSTAGVPVVQIMDIDGDPVDACVGFSHVQAGFEIGTALMNSGLCRIGYLGRNLHKDFRAARRKQGFEAALKARGLDFISAVSDIDSTEDMASLTAVEFGRDMTAALLARCSDLDGIYFSNDDLAFGGLCHCLGAGIDVPRDLALAGFNGLDLIEGFPGKIATSRTARKQIGEQAAAMILATQGSARAGSDGRRVGAERCVLKPEIDLGELSQLRRDVPGK